MSVAVHLGDKIAAQYLVERGSSMVARYRSGKVHLMDMAGSSHRAKCGAALLPNNYGLSTNPSLGTGEEWCYSCLGNALEYIERDRVRSQH